MNITGKKKKVWAVLTSLPLEFALTVERIAIARNITCKDAFLMCLYQGIEAERRKLSTPAPIEIKPEDTRKSIFDDM